MAVQADLLRGTPLTAMVNANRRQPTQLDLYNERRRKEIQSQSNQFQKLASPKYFARLHASWHH